MYVNALGTALPEKRYTKQDCWEAFTASEWFGLLEPRSRAIAKLVLTRENGIDERWLSVDSLDEVFAIDPETLHRRFASHAPRLAAAAGEAALRRAALTPEAIDAVIVTTCTGYLCPGLSGYVIERLGLRQEMLEIVRTTVIPWETACEAMRRSILPIGLIRNASMYSERRSVHSGA